MLRRFHFGKNGAYDSLFIDHKGRPLGPEVCLAIHLLLNPDAVGLDHCLPLVADEGKGQVVFGDEFTVLFERIDAHPEHLRPL